MRLLACEMAGVGWCVGCLALEKGSVPFFCVGEEGGACESVDVS